MSKTRRILGIDTSLRSSGIGIVEMTGNRLSAVDYETVKVSSKASLSECLRSLHNAIDAAIERTHPDAAAIEGVFYCKNFKTAFVLGEARGVAIHACACRKLEVYEYAPRKVKQAIVGFGGASKKQIQEMITRLLALESAPREDEADALAIAICHLHSITGAGALQMKTV